MKLFKFLFFSVFLAACGQNTDHEDRRTRPNTEIEKLRKEVLRLQGVTEQLSSLVMSDFAACPNSGDTADALVRKICQVAQAATVESRVQIKGEMSSLIKALQDKLDASNDQLSDLQSSYDTIAADLADLTADLAALESRVDDAETAIDALEASVASINGTLNGTMQSIDIGTENLAAGPLYESLLRRVDKTRINAYIDAYSSWLSLGINPVSSSNNNPTVTITKPTATVTISNASPAVVTRTSHGWADGDPVMFSSTGSLPTGVTANTIYYVRNKTTNTFNLSSTPIGALVNTSGAGSGLHSSSLGLVGGDLVATDDITGGNGFTRGHVYGELLVNSGATTASFTVTLSRPASGGGSFGGTSGLIRRVQGRGIGTIWQTSDGADITVRQTTLGTRRYNFIIQADGDACYDTTNAEASFATINAEGVGIVCK